jgi:hypothetical protein
LSAFCFSLFASCIIPKQPGFKFASKKPPKSKKKIFW